MNSLNSASSLLNSVAPPGERLAYLNPEEEALLKEMGGAGQDRVAGIPSYWKPFKDPFGKKKAARQAQEAQERKIAEAKQEQQENIDRSNFFDMGIYPKNFLYNYNSCSWFSCRLRNIS